MSNLTSKLKGLATGPVGIILALIIFAAIVLFVPKEPEHIRKVKATYHEALAEKDHMTAYMSCAELVNYYHEAKDQKNEAEWTKKGQAEMPYVWGPEFK